MVTWVCASAGRFLTLQTGLYLQELTYSFQMNGGEDSVEEKEATRSRESERSERLIQNKNTLQASNEH